jgi:hypothetical protein
MEITQPFQVILFSMGKDLTDLGICRMSRYSKPVCDTVLYAY